MGVDVIDIFGKKVSVAETNGSTATFNVLVRGGAETVDRVLGNASKTAPATWVETKRALDFGIDGEEKVKIDDFAAVHETALHLVDGFEGRARAFLAMAGPAASASMHPFFPHPQSGPW